jgi:bifunctional non-homologous end joining protein LigD
MSMRSDLTLTHPDRIVYRGQGITKRDLAEYYATIAPFMLPHITDRPLAVMRCPDGEGAHCFSQKHWTSSTPHISTKPIAESGGEKGAYAVVHDAAGLIALVQYGVLEIHPWGSRADKLEAPDRIVFDLDPGPDVRWKDVVAAALELRALLADLGLESWVKTAGGKGLHVVVPIARTVEWDVVSLFSHAVAQRLVHEAPSRYVAVAAKAARRERIFVDYLRNSRGATAIAPFSTRAREGAPVAMPLKWEDLPKLKSGDAFHVRDVLAMPSDQLSDPWADLLASRQRLSRAVIAHLE